MVFTDDREVQERAARLDKLLESLETADASATRDTAVEAIQTLLDLYGDGLSRIMASVGRNSEAALDETAQDPLVSHLLMVHGLHPIDIDTRVQNALDSVRPYLESHGGGVDYLGIEDGKVRLSLKGTCETCPASTVTLKLAVEDAILKAAPDVMGIEPDDGEVGTSAGNGTSANGDGRSSWTTVGDLSTVTPGSMHPIDIDGEATLLLNVKTTYYAYRNSCPGCGAALDGGQLVEKNLECPSCARTYDVRRAGRCLQDPEVHLAPVPLIMDGDIAQVAVAGH